MSETRIFNAQLVLPERVVRGALVFDEGGILGIEEGAAGARGPGLDLDGDFLLPGLVDLHSDHLETHAHPRPGVEWPALSAALAYDAQAAAAGITTIFDSLVVGLRNENSQRRAFLARALDALARARDGGLLKVEHYLHLRCEVTDPELPALLDELIARPELRLLSLMEHTPGQRQFADAEAYRTLMIERFHHSAQSVEKLIAEQRQASRDFADRLRRETAARGRARGIALASHDDETPAHVEEAAELGMALAEFPTTLAAAEVARARGLAVVMGAPNLVRGGSQSGNVSAAALAERGLLDILASDYVPAGLLPAAFALARSPFSLPLAEAVATVTASPAAAVGLADRGRLEKGLRADLIRVREVEGLPILRGLWRAGHHVM